MTLTGEELCQLYVPPGFAHGYCVSSDVARVQYKCTDYYHPECQHVVRWDDPALGITWPVERPQMAARDAEAPALAEIPVEWLPG